MIKFFNGFRSMRTTSGLIDLAAEKHDSYSFEDWLSMFALIGKTIMEDIGEDVFNLDKVQVFVDLLLEKHKLYGAAPLAKWGPLGVVIRIDSKYARVKNMRKLNYTPITDESIHDTLWDILGYCILGFFLVKRRM